MEEVRWNSSHSNCSHARNPGFTDSLKLSDEFFVRDMLGRRRWYSIFGERKVIIGRIEWILQELNVRALQCSKNLDRAISHGVRSL